MTDDEIKQAEKEAEQRARELVLLLLLLFGKKDSKGLEVVRFDAAKGRFYYNGRSVSVKEIRKQLLRIETQQGRKLAQITDDLINEKMTIAEWKREFDRTITSTHILAGALALGGIAVSVRNAGIQAAIASEIKFADGFAKDVRRKKGSAAQWKARARKYSRAIHITFSNTELEVRKLLGLQTEARRIRRAAESCSGCIEWSRKGWVSIEEMIPIGRLECGVYCRCYIEYR